MKKYKNKNWLNRKYWTEELSTYQIAKLCNCNKTTIWRQLKKFNISIRSAGEGVHLITGNHCKLSKEARQWLDGELLGDGCLYSYSKSKYAASFVYDSKHKEYIKYISDVLRIFGIRQSGKINKRYHKKQNYYSYHYCSLAYAELLPIKKRWYPNKKKIIPKDLKLTSLVLRQEHIGDGSLIKGKYGKLYITLATCGFLVSDVEWLKEKLIKLGFKTTRYSSSNVIHISTHSTKDFLDYIGECPVRCYKYKFNYYKR